MITQQVLQRLLDYDIYTGKFTWIQARKDFIGTIAGCSNTNGYIQIRVLGCKYPAHKLAFLWMEDVYPALVDHIDTNITNNSWANLRICNKYQNSQNKNIAKNNILGVKGIIKDKFGYRARIQAYTKKYSKRFSIPKYSTEEIALTAAIDWLVKIREELHKEFANHG